MTKFKEHYRELQYRPEAAKSLRRILYGFIRREFPRLGGSWVVRAFVDKLLEIVDSYRFHYGTLKPGQVVWPAVAVEVSPHRLRHTLATRLVNAGMDVVSIQRLLGHEKLDTTMIYIHVHDITVERDFRQAMARLEAGHERRSAAAQTGSMLLVEEPFAHTCEPVCVATQASDCV